MYQHMRWNWKIRLFTLAILFFSIFSFSCATLSSLGKESIKKGYPAHSKAPLRLPAVSKYINTIAENLLKQELAERIGFPNVDVVVLETSRIQGRSALSGPRIEVTRGMLNVMINEAELACLISHEIGHKALHRKSNYKKEQEDKSYKEKLGDVFLSDEMQKAKWNQRREEEADEYGAMLCRKAGYDAYALVGFFDRLSHFQEKGFLASLSELTATHKDFRNRSKHLREYLEKSGIQHGEGKLNEEEYRRSLTALKVIHTNDVVNEVLPGGASSALQKLNTIEDELKGYERTEERLPVTRFIEIMEELRGISEKYGIDISSIQTANLIYPPSNTYYVFMKEVMSQDSPVWADEEPQKKIESILQTMGRVGGGNQIWIHRVNPEWEIP